MEGAGRGGVDGGERRDGRMDVGFVLLAGCTTFDVFTDIGGKAGPPEFSCDKLLGFEVARVTSTFVVVATLEDSVPQGVVIWDIDAALIGQDACFNLPVGEAGTEGERKVIVHGLEGLEDEGVTRGRRLDTVGEGDVNNVDEERWRKEDVTIASFPRLTFFSDSPRRSSLLPEGGIPLLCSFIALDFLLHRSVLSRRLRSSFYSCSYHLPSSSTMMHPSD